MKGIRVEFIGTPVAMRIVPHTSNPDRLVLKSQHPEAGAALCKQMGVNVQKCWTGSHYFLTEVDRHDFTAKLGSAMSAFLTPQVVKQLSAPKCEECGCDDGGHWQFCPQHESH